MALLSFNSVIKKYRDGSEEIRAVDNMTFEVAAGEMVAIMGPSGCGKSTLLHLAGGIEPVTAGSVAFDGRVLADMSANELALLRRRDVGYVFQELNLVESLTAIENVSLPLELDGVKAKAARAEALDRLRSVGIAEQVDRYPSEFSGGQQQRIAIARALVGGRRLILADEPTGALDTATGDGVVDLLAGLTSTGVSVLLVTHESRLASWADRVMFLRDGRIVDEATARVEMVGSAMRPANETSEGV